MQMEEFREYDNDLLSRFVQQRNAPWLGVALRSNRQISIAGGVICEPFKYLGGIRIKTDRWVGTFSLQGHRFQINPRVGSNRFWAMLSESEGLPTAGTLRAAGGVAAGELGRDILALLWTSALEHGRKLHGITKGYVFCEEPEALTLRGQVDLRRQLTENELGKKHRVACMYDDLTYDNPVNRGIMATINRLRREGIFPFNDCSGSFSRREMLSSWQDRLTSLGVRIDGKPIPSHHVRWTRANDGFRRCHQLGERLLRHMGATTVNSGLDEALLFDSAEVWEIFLLQRMQRVVARKEGLRIQSPRLLSESIDCLMNYKRIIRGGLLPDYRLQKRSADGRWETIAILDAKYRALESVHGTYVPSGDEVIQMALYSCNSGAIGKPLPCMLIYPRVASGFDASGINENAKLQDNAEPLGETFLNVISRPNLSWWVIDIPEAEMKFDWAERIDAQLTNIIEWAIRNSCQRA